MSRKTKPEVLVDEVCQKPGEVVVDEVSGRRGEVVVDEYRDIPGIGRCRFKKVAYSPTIDEILDRDRDRGLIAPDTHFLLKSIAGCGADKVKDVWRRAFLELLRNHQRLGITLSQEMLNRTADELERLWWPDPKAWKRRRRLANAETLRNTLEIFEAKYRREGVKRPRSTAKEEIARHFGYASGEALRKDLQANRVNRQPRRKNRRPRRKPHG